jgi:hypothetical protein
MHRSLIPFALLLAALAAPAGAQTVILQGPPGQPVPGPRTGPRDPAQPPAETGTAVVRGRVIGGESGTPLRRAVVRISGQGMQEGRMTTTDEQGRYEFKELPAGRFGLFANKGGYVAMQYGQRRPLSGGKPIELADGQVLQGVDFNLPRGGVIAGRITDELGEPMPEVSIRIMRYRYIEGRRELVPVGPGSMVRTDDQGRYRAYGLPAGDYYVSAVIEGGMYWAAQSDTRTGFAPTYYPGTPSASEAQRVRLAAGTENAGINFALVPARTVEVTGTVIDSTGQPLGRGFVMVREGAAGSFMVTMRGGGPVKPDGTFRVANLSPGEYVLHVNTAMGTNDDAESADVPISIGSEDLTGITIVTSRAAVVRGQVITEMGTTPPGRASEFQFWVTTAEPGMSGMSMRTAGAVTKDDWTFEGRVPSDTTVVIRQGRFPDGWMLKAVLVDGVDVTDTGLTVRSGQDADGVQILVTNRISTVGGAVQGVDGSPERDYVVIVFADDPARWHGRSRYVRQGRPDQRGRFEIPQLPPGAYLAAALDSVEDGQQGDPEFLQELRAHATLFQLGEGEQKTLSLRMVQR